MFDADSTENLARVATVLGVLAIPIAWMTLTSTWDASRASHMNTLFREFLRIEFDYFNQPGNAPGKGPAWQSLRSYKMWVLEEIWISALLGLGVVPQATDPLAAAIPADVAAAGMKDIRTMLAGLPARLPGYPDYLKRLGVPT